MEDKRDFTEFIKTNNAIGIKNNSGISVEPLSALKGLHDRNELFEFYKKIPSFLEQYRAELDKIKGKEEKPITINEFKEALKVVNNKNRSMFGPDEEKTKEAVRNVLNRNKENGEELEGR